MRVPILGIFLPCVLLLVLPAAAEPVQGVVGFAQDDLSNDWRRAQVREVRAVLAGYSDVKLRVTDARGQPALQALHIERLARGGVDVLITSPANARLLAPIIQRVHASGTPVILLSRGIPGESYTAFVHPDNRAITERLAHFVIDRLGGKGKVLVLRGVPGATTTERRTEVFRRIVGEHPGIRVTTRTGNYLRPDAIRAVEDVLAAHDGGFPFDALYAQSDSMAVGARLALRRAGIDPAGILIAGIDYIGEAREAIRQGEQDVSFTYPTGGAEGGELALDLLRGEPIPREVVLESIRVTPANVDEVPPIFRIGQ